MDINVMDYLRYFVDSLVFNAIDAVTVAVAIVIVIWVLKLAVPTLKWSDVKSNPIAIALLLSIALLVFAIISASSTLAPLPPEAPDGVVEEKVTNVQE